MLIPSELTDTFREVTLADALELAARLGYDRTRESDQQVVAVLRNGVEIAWQSECCGPYSEETPDIDWRPPTIWARRVPLE
jgi:hypothetical protein